MTALLSVADIHTYYGDSHILQGISLELAPGEVLGILGRNGVGKTTLLQSILGLPSPRAGEIRFKGNVISGLPTYAIIRSGMTWVPQGHRVFPSLTVLEGLQLAATHARPGPWSLERVFDQFPILRERGHARAGTLSGGEQQMLAIARALIANPELVLMDEPSEGLSPRIVDEVGDIIQRLNSEGCAILIVEQNLSFALRHTKRVLVMNKGRIVYVGRGADLAADEQICRQYLGVTASSSVRADAVAQE
jgi:branched-chain amino acid transport system ATP-binding protein